MRSHILRTAIFAGMSLLVVFETFAGNRKIAHAYTDSDAYEIYSAVLPHTWLWTQLNAQNFVILKETKGHSICAASSADPSDTQAGNGGRNTAQKGQKSSSTTVAIANYKKLNRQSWILEHKLHISRSYSFIGRGELAGITHQEIGAWGLFFEHHEDSGGWIQFSAVGFDADKTTAVVYAAYECGPNCRGGAFYSLKKQGSHWKVSDPLPDDCGELIQQQMTGF